MVVWSLFIACTAVILLTGTLLSKYGDILAEKSGLGRTWIGVIFFLERAGFGSARKLTAIFYLKDFAVPKVMLSAILVAMVGLLALERIGILDFDLIAAMPTYLWPQLVGGLLLGIGFVVGGYCPGTSAVGAASGKGDALAFMAGLVAGIFGFTELFDRLESFYFSGDLGEFTLSEWTALPPAGVVVVLLLVAGAAFWWTRRFEWRPCSADARASEDGAHGLGGCASVGRGGGGAQS